MSSKLDTVTARMSKLMLKRWSMLAEVCPQEGCSVPLMRRPGSDETKCVSHDARELFPDEFEEDDGDCAADSEPEVASTEALSAPMEDEKMDAEKNDIRQKRREQGDLASERLGKRLLEGWTMLDRPCPNDSCYNVPLVQDKNKVQLCVICNKQYMDEAAYIERYGRMSDEPTKPAARVPEVPATAQQTKKAAEETPAPAPKTQLSAVPDVAASGAIGTLNIKIEGLAARLAATADLTEIERISRAISACAEAIWQCKRAGI
ncbi:hypothetical protein GGF46_001637 [Coemansia sp. RSA 552]|nr:hypothetical protein GGF46_001637 [Coemansia sp. RSA 552]